MGFSRDVTLIPSGIMFFHRKINGGAGDQSGEHEAVHQPDVLGQGIIAGSRAIENPVASDAGISAGRPRKDDAVGEGGIGGDGGR